MSELEAHRQRLQERAISSVHDGDRTPVIDIQDAARDLIMTDGVARDEFQRHEVWDREQEQRIMKLETCVEHLRTDMSHVKDKTDEIHSVVNNGLKDKLRELAQAVAALSSKQPTMKKPRRLEVMLAIMTVLAVASSVGLFDAVRQALAAWLTGGS